MGVLRDLFTALKMGKMGKNPQKSRFSKKILFLPLPMSGPKHTRRTTF